MTRRGGIWYILTRRGCRDCETVGPQGPEGDEMKKYVCKVCGWVYDPAEHDNVAFESLPDDWTCPVCGVGKDQFQEA